MFEKIIEGRNVSYVVRLGKSIDEYPLFMDATRAFEDAIRRDRRNGYEPEDGPHYGIERYRADEYVGYVTEVLNRDNFFKFDTKSYRFFLGSVPMRKPHNGGQR